MDYLYFIVPISNVLTIGILVFLLWRVHKSKMQEKNLNLTFDYSSNTYNYYRNRLSYAYA
jgi:hypothetical protein